MFQGWKGRGRGMLGKSEGMYDATKSFFSYYSLMIHIYIYFIYCMFGFGLKTMYVHC